MQLMGEKVYFDRENITVTKTRFIAHGKTYAMNTVSSVEVRQEPPRMGCLFLIVTCGLLIFASAAFATGISVVALLVIGLGVMAVGVVGITKQNKRFTLLLTTSAHEIAVLTSSNKSFIYQIKDAVEESIIDRA
jgi:hypothetical protein